MTVTQPKRCVKFVLRLAAELWTACEPHHQQSDEKTDENAYGYSIEVVSPYELHDHIFSAACSQTSLSMLMYGQ